MIGLHVGLTIWLRIVLVKIIFYIIILMKIYFIHYVYNVAFMLEQLLLELNNHIETLNYLIPKFEDLNDQFNSLLQSNGCYKDASNFYVPSNHPDAENLGKRLKVISELKTGIDKRILSEFNTAFEKEKTILGINPEYKTQLRGILDRASNIDR